MKTLVKKTILATFIIAWGTSHIYVVEASENESIELKIINNTTQELSIHVGAKRSLEDKLFSGESHTSVPSKQTKEEEFFLDKEFRKKVYVTGQTVLGLGQMLRSATCTLDLDLAKKDSYTLRFFHPISKKGKQITRKILCEEEGKPKADKSHR